jgi:hypothetical protein
VLCRGKRFETSLQLANFRTHDVLPVVKHALDAGIDCGFEVRVLGLEINEMNQ